jgi:uncharacterized protein YaaR (DUF327 family)
LENLLQTLLAYFNKNPKKHLELSKLVKIMKTKGNKLSKNIETKWISMLDLAKEVMVEYCTSMVKMALDYLSNNSMNLVNFKVLFDIKVLYELEMFLPILESVNNHTKVAEMYFLLIT